MTMMTSGKDGRYTVADLEHMIREAKTGKPLDEFKKKFPKSYTINSGTNRATAQGPDVERTIPPTGQSNQQPIDINEWLNAMRPFVEDFLETVPVETADDLVKYFEPLFVWNDNNFALMAAIHTMGGEPDTMMLEAMIEANSEMFTKDLKRGLAIGIYWAMASKVSSENIDDLLGNKDLLMETAFEDFAPLWRDITAKVVATASEKLRRKTGRRLPSIPDVSQGGYSIIPSSPPLTGLLRSTENAAEGAGNWTDSEGTTAPTYRHPVGRSGSKGIVDVSLRGYEGEDRVPDSMLTTLWDQVNELDDLTGDVLLAALAQSLGTGGNGRTWITADAILNYRGIKPKTKREGDSQYRAGHHLEHRMSVARAFEQLDHLWLNLIDVEVVAMKGKSRKPQKLRLESKAISISDRISQGGLGGGYVAIAWHYQPGEWAKPFLSPGFRETALLAQKSLQYDPYHQIWEKRLARYFALHWRIRAPHGNYEQPYRIVNLLETISIKPNERFPLRTRERLEKALDQLQADGVIARWEYQRWEEKLPTKRWLATWLEWTILVTPPEKVIHYYTSLAKNYKRRRSLPKEASVSTTPSLS